ncbi:PfkB family carbohydrate kinase [Nitrosovibrio tenuis]|uniref:Fructokinase n=1 Tax=Nitrosovibrio tenuis TaxID=1233 RepID=A0A1H7JV77_9PROT|nr:PfkB family carbohydrate kinase [Nitrosovibrio tenuis]SEK78254.1 fructokinase [Nitrosovibrio tenuis]
MIDARHVVLLFGEILIDRFPDREVLGGAPFNVARHLCAFGCAPVLITRIGLDEAGGRALQSLESSGLTTHGVQLDSIHSTGVVQVHFTSERGHRFDILPDQAYDHIHPRLARIAALAAKPELVYFGTLAQRSDSHRALRHMLRAASGQRFFDVNLRNPWICVERLHWSLKHADIMKANDAELELLNQLLDLKATSAEAQAGLLAQRYSLRGVLITCGADGAWWLDGSGLIAMPSAPVAGIRDTVGAGDAFSAIFMLGLLHGWTTPVTLRRAHHFAGAICQIRGAVPDYGDFYDPFIREWLPSS